MWRHIQRHVLDALAATGDRGRGSDAKEPPLECVRHAVCVATAARAGPARPVVACVVPPANDADWAPPSSRRLLLAAQAIDRIWATAYLG